MVSVSSLETAKFKEWAEKVKVPNGGTVVKVSSEGKSRTTKREVEKPEVEKRKFIIHGREFWLSKDELSKEYVAQE